MPPQSKKRLPRSPHRLGKNLEAAASLSHGTLFLRFYLCCAIVIATCFASLFVSSLVMAAGEAVTEPGVEHSEIAAAPEPQAPPQPEAPVETIAPPPPAPVEPPAPAVVARIDEVNITFYDCAGDGFCGEMFNGRQVYEGAAACSWNLRIGTTFRIPGDPTQRIYICEDRGLLADTWVDIFWHHPADGYRWHGYVGRFGAIEIVQHP